MREILKSTLLSLPVPAKRFIVRLREFIWSLAGAPAKDYLHSKKPNEKAKANILIYALHGLRHAGTEKNLQLIANSLADQFNVFYMYGEEPGTDDRQSQLNQKITFVPFSYTASEIAIPHKIHDMDPTLPEILQAHSIDLIITASPGYSHYPWNKVKDIPIILLNIFGAPTLQSNIEAVIYNSKTTKSHAEKWIGQDERGHIKYAPLYNLPKSNTRELGHNLRGRLNIKETDFVFGRIGRADDSIFDPIAIRAWQSIADTYQNAHFVVMSPAPSLIKIVETEKIPRVHFLPPSSHEDDVWAFHGSLDAFAHFRYDGETSGVAIAESLTVGNPVITHRSKIWNAHLEYLNQDIARVANIDNSFEYALFMREFIEIKQKDTPAWENMGLAAKNVGDTHFSPHRYAEFINNLVSRQLEGKILTNK